MLAFNICTVQSGAIKVALWKCDIVLLNNFIFGFAVKIKI